MGPFLAAAYVLLSVLLMWAAVRLEGRASVKARRVERLRRYSQRFVAAVEVGDLRSAEAELVRWFRTAGEHTRRPPTVTRNWRP
jgi:hypothetical protein